MKQIFNVPIFCSHEPLLGALSKSIFFIAALKHPKWINKTNLDYVMPKMYFISGVHACWVIIQLGLKSWLRHVWDDIGYI